MSAPASPERAPATVFECGGTRAIAGVSSLLERFDGFIVDQWGVLHDGVTAYPDAIECLRRLRAAGKHVVVLSNSGRREAENIRQMQRMGFDAALFDRFIGAGEDARAAIAARSSDFHRTLGTRCFAFTRDGDRSLIDGIGLEIVGSVAAADFLMVIGIDSPQRNCVDYEAELRAGLERGLPLVCANPDIVRVSPQGLLEAPGILAQRYEALGGRVFYHGKPYPAIYHTCLKAMPGCAPERVAAIGDSLEHDVLGATRAGLASVFVAGGIHADALVGRWGEMPAPDRWRQFIAGAAVKPDYLLPAFVW